MSSPTPLPTVICIAVLELTGERDDRRRLFDLDVVGPGHLVRVVVGDLHPHDAYELTVYELAMFATRRSLNLAIEGSPTVIGAWATHLREAIAREVTTQ